MAWLADWGLEGEWEDGEEKEPWTRVIWMAHGGGYKATHMEEALTSCVDPTTHSVDVNPPLSSGSWIE